jgi:hypothetical protein
MIPAAEERPTLPLWPDACRAFNIGRSAGYDLVARGEFPCRVITVGNRYRVVTADLRRVLGLPSADVPRPPA